MSQYAIRIDTSAEHEVVQYIKSISLQFALAEEYVKELTHIHIYTQTYTPVQTIRNNLRKHGFQGNKSYSISILKDLVKYLAYMQKQSSLYHENITEDVLNQAKEYKEGIKEKKNQLDVLEKLVPEYVLKSMAITGDSSSTKLLTVAIVDHYLKERKLIRKFQIKTIVDTIGCKYSQRYREEFINFL